MGVELQFEEVQKLFHKEKHWGWIESDSGFKMYLGGNDDTIALRFHHGYTYEPTSRRLWRSLCKDAELVLDIGAHSGVFSLEAYKAGAKMVFSAEPHPINFSRLVLNLRYNGFGYQGAYFGAIGEDNGVGELLVKQLYMCHAAGRMETYNANGFQVQANVRKLDSLLTDNMDKVKAVKIDAENWTPNVLRGMKDLLEYRPYIILECTQEGMSEYLPDYEFWMIKETGEIIKVDSLTPYNPNNSYNGTDEDSKNRFCSVRGLP